MFYNSFLITISKFFNKFKTLKLVLPQVYLSELEKRTQYYGSFGVDLAQVLYNLMHQLSV